MTTGKHLAFPAFNSKGECAHDSAGLTIREYFAAMAMQGFLSSYTNAIKDPDVTHVAQKAVEYADALIEALNKTHNHEIK